jgi:hypothetical protein
MLKEAYDRNDLKKVNTILRSLETGTAFKLKSDSITEKSAFQAVVQTLRLKIRDMELYIFNLREHQTHQTILAIKDMDTYFADKRVRLTEELERLRRQVGEIE